MLLHALQCCGIKEIQGLRDWNEDKFFHLCQSHSNGAFPCAWVCFNGVAYGGYVQTFRQFLLTHKLGRIIDLPQVRNPNSSNILDIGMWEVDRAAVGTWMRSQAGRHDWNSHDCTCRLCLQKRPITWGLPTLAPPVAVSDRLQAAAARLREPSTYQPPAGMVPGITQYASDGSRVYPSANAVREALRNADSSLAQAAIEQSYEQHRTNVAPPPNAPF